MNTNFYVYEYYTIDDNKVFYVGKGTKNRMFEMHNRNDAFNEIYNNKNCNVRIYKDNLSEEDAFNLEIQHITELKSIGEATCNFTYGGVGFSTGDLNPRFLNPLFGDNNPMHTHNIDFTGEKNPFFGKQHTEESKQKISEAKKGKEIPNLKGEKNGMFGKHLTAGEKNGMFGKTAFEHPNSKMYKITYLDNSTEFLTSKQGVQKFGAAFNRIKDIGGDLHFSSNSINKIYEGVSVERVK